MIEHYQRSRIAQADSLIERDRQDGSAAGDDPLGRIGTCLRPDVVYDVHRDTLAPY